MALTNPSAIYMAVPEYGVDKIYFTTSGSQTISGTNPSIGPATEIIIPQTKGEAFFTQLLLSQDNSTWFTSGFPPYAFNTTYGQYSPLFSGTLFTTTTDVHLFLQSTEISRAIYYKIVGFSVE